MVAWWLPQQLGDSSIYLPAERALDLFKTCTGEFMQAALACYVAEMPPRGGTVEAVSAYLTTNHPAAGRIMSN